MFYLVLWTYTLSIIVIWWFFVVAKIHAYKFKNFSPHIKKVTFWLTFSLVVMSILGYILVFSIKSSLDNFSVWNNTSFSNIIEKDTDKTERGNDSNVIDYNDF